VFMACLYSAYMYGRDSMYADMLEAVGAGKGAKLMVITPNPSEEPLYHEAGICATCHGSA